MTDLADRLRRFSYKPGWTIRLGEENGRPAIVVVARVPDVRDPQRSTIVRGGEILPRNVEALDDEQFIALVRRAKDVVERHEADEWFMVDGKPVNDPHAPKCTCDKVEVGLPGSGEYRLGRANGCQVHASKGSG